jgi:hypothetical protein
MTPPFARAARREARRDLDQHRRARSVVVGAVVHLAGAVGVEAPEAAEAEVVVMRADDDRLVPQHRVASGQQADHVATLEPRHVRVLGHGRVARNGERLKPSACGRLEPHGPESTRQVGGGGVGAGASRQASVEPVVAQEPDVVERQHRRRGGAHDLARGGAHLLGAQGSGGGERRESERGGESKTWRHTVEE